MDLYFSIPAVIAQIFNPVTQLVTRTRIPTKKAKAEMEIHPVIVEITTNKWSIKTLYKLFYASYSVIRFDLCL